MLSGPGEHALRWLKLKLKRRVLAQQCQDLVQERAAVSLTAAAMPEVEG